MSLRLLSFLTDIERALHAEDPSPQGGAWENTRSVNYDSGIARLTLATRSGLEVLQPLGTILLQYFVLADGTSCLKIFLSWSGSESQTSHTIFTRTEVDWTTEARRIATTWSNGAVKGSMPAAEEAQVAGASRLGA